MLPSLAALPHSQSRQPAPVDGFLDEDLPGDLQRRIALALGGTSALHYNVLINANRVDGLSTRWSMEVTVSRTVADQASTPPLHTYDPTATPGTVQDVVDYRDSYSHRANTLGFEVYGPWPATLGNPTAAVILLPQGNAVVMPQEATAAALLTLFMHLKADVLLRRYVEYDTGMDTSNWEFKVSKSSPLLWTEKKIYNVKATATGEVVDGTLGRLNRLLHYAPELRLLAEQRAARERDLEAQRAALLARERASAAHGRRILAGEEEPWRPTQPLPAPALPQAAPPRNRRRARRLAHNPPSETRSL